MVTDLRAAAECEIDEVDPVGVKNGEGFGATLRICARICRVVTELEDVTGLLERRLLKMRPVPFLSSVSELRETIQTKYKNLLQSHVRD